MRRREASVRLRPSYALTCESSRKPTREGNNCSEGDGCMSSIGQAARLHGIISLSSYCGGDSPRLRPRRRWCFERLLRSESTSRQKTEVCRDEWRICRWAARTGWTANLAASGDSLSKQYAQSRCRHTPKYCLSLHPWLALPPIETESHPGSVLKVEAIFKNPGRAVLCGTAFCTQPCCIVDLLSEPPIALKYSFGAGMSS